jgi:Flp pilus assembly protein TadG
MNKFMVKENGSVLITVAILLTLLISIVALAIDFGYQYVVKNQVQNAADAAALAGADILFQNGVNSSNFDTMGGAASTTTNCANTTPITQKAACEAATKISMNENSTYTLQVNVDRWNNLTTSWDPANPYNYPAVKVVLSQTSVPYFFAGLMGFANGTVSASAIAVTRYASSVGKGVLHFLPAALSACAFTNNYTSPWDSHVGQTFSFGYTYGPIGWGCDAFEWTSLEYNNNVGASTIRDILSGGTPAQTGLAPNAPYATSSDCHPPGSDDVNTCIHVETGVKESDIKAFKDLVGQTYKIPIVYQLNTGTNQPIEAYACARLENVCASNGYFGTFTGGRSNSTEPGTTQPNKCSGNKAYFSVTILASGCDAGGTGGNSGSSSGVTSSPQLAPTR